MRQNKKIAMSKHNTFNAVLNGKHYSNIDEYITDLEKIRTSGDNATINTSMSFTSTSVEDKPAESAYRQTKTPLKPNKIFLPFHDEILNADYIKNFIADIKDMNSDEIQSYLDVKYEALEELYDNLSDNVLRRNTVEQLNTYLDAVTRIIDRLDCDSTFLEARYESAAEDIKVKQLELSNIKAKCNELVEQIKSLEKMHSDKTNEINKLSAEHDQISNTLDLVYSLDRFYSSVSDAVNDELEERERINNITGGKC